MKRLGDAAWRWEIAEDVDKASLLDALRRTPGVIDAVVTERHACVVVAPGASFESAAIEPAAVRPVVAREHVIRVRYDGPDLAEIATRAKVAADEVVRRHTARTYVVSMIGFLPGFAYLREVDPTIAAPRRGSPRVRVPAGAVGIAGPYTAVYPFASPGGWNLVGAAVGFRAFDPSTGSALALGDRVRFEPVP